MAYVSQEDKKRIAVGVKAVFKKYGVSGTLSVRHHSTLVAKLRKGSLNLEAGSSPNPYWIESYYEGVEKEFYKELIDAMKGSEYFDHSDIQTDYFNCSHYVNVQVVDNYKFEG